MFVQAVGNNLLFFSCLSSRAHRLCLTANGYRGTFYKFVEGETPVMKAADCMDYLSLLYCKMLYEVA